MNLMVRAIILIAGLSILWHGIVILFNLPPYILPTPWQVLKTFYSHFTIIALETWPTVLETLIGFLAGIIVGCFAAILMSYCRPVGFWFLPVMIISQAIPTFAIAPLLVIWFGYGMASKIICTILMIFFPITSAFYDGLCNTEKPWLDLAKTMHGKKFRIFYYIRIPAAFPQLASGLRIAAVFAPIGAIIGEWVGASKGLGYLMLNANARMQIDLMFAALIVIVILSLLLYFVVDKLLNLTLTLKKI